MYRVDYELVKPSHLSRYTLTDAYSVEEEVMATKKAAPKKAPTKKTTKTTAKKAPAKKKKAAPRKKTTATNRKVPKKKAGPKAPNNRAQATTPVDGHFQGKPAGLRKIYDVLVKELRKFGPFRADAVKTSINLIHRYHFGSVTVQDEALRLGFVSDVRARSGRIVQTQELGPERIGHSVKLESTSDVDVELLGWLRRAYELQG